ncbi:MAG: hypothetical protein IPK71_30645 [Myxococcales bacterium]|nr:hypothetical protein [Myxococcales bacterium]
MERRTRQLVTAAALAIGLTFAIGDSPAFADPKTEAGAKALQKKAMEEDYLATEFAKAKEKLEKALAACGADKCAPGVKALLHRDLGVVYVGGLNDKDKGQAAFAEALKADPAVALDKDLTTKEITAVFEAAKKGGGAPAPGPGPGPSKGPSGDFVHTPFPEQQVRTSVPVLVEYGGEEKLVKVLVRYKGFGMTEFKQFELRKLSEKQWGGNSPCGDVQTGDFLYYIQGFNDQNDPVATAGSRNEPYKTKITAQAVADAPHLPNQPAPTQCADTGDCPPDFPGCKKKPPTGGGDEPTGKPEGEACVEDNECQSNKCEKDKGADPLDKGVCTAPAGGPKGYRKFWAGLQFGMDFAFLPSGDDVCKLDDKNNFLPLKDTGYYCYDSGGSRDYPTRPTNTAERAENDAITAGQANNKVQGGVAPATIRILATADYGVTKNIMIGARLGLVVNTYPGTEGGVDGKGFSAPIHLEARGTYLFGDGLAKTKGIVPYAFLGGGISNWDAKVGVTVTEARQPSPSTANCTKTGTGQNCTVDAWYLGGPGFIGFGGGVRIMATERVAIPLGLRMAFALGNGVLPAISPELGVQFGF